jgi:Na+/melibiose symporter-like transporter
MEEKKHLLEPLLEITEEYVKTKYEIVKLKTIDKTAGTLSTLLSHSIIVVTLSVFVLMVSIGAALWIGDLLGKSYYGFFCIASFYGLIGYVLYFFMYKTIKKRIENSIISHLLN